VFAARGAGLHVLVRSSRAVAWEALARSVSTVSLGHPPQGRDRPLAAVLDADPIVGEPPPGEPARVTFLLREELTTWGANVLGWADVVILQSPSEAEATLAARALGIARSQADLERMADDMAAVVSQGSVQWVRLQPTPLELDLIGPPGRH
jgi:ESX secretion system protein EccE